MKRLLVTAVVLCGGQLFAQTLHVPVQYISIQSAIDEANDGDTVVVHPGTYYENISFLGKAITVLSVDPNDDCMLYWGQGNIDADPCFASAGYWDDASTPADPNDDFFVVGDFYLLPTSPCVDAGDNSSVGSASNADLDSEQRIFGELVDMGADEVVTNPMDLNNDGVVDYLELVVLMSEWLLGGELQTDFSRRRLHRLCRLCGIGRPVVLERQLAPIRPQNQHLAIGCYRALCFLALNNRPIMHLPGQVADYESR